MTANPPSARAIALDILRLVLDQQQALDGLWDRHPGFLRLPRRDRAFVRQLVTTTLRRLGQIDDALKAFVARPLPAKAGRVRHVLRLGACQLLFLGTPPHAAVSTALEVLDLHRFGSFKGLANAVLRRLAEQGPAIVAGQDAPRLNTPDWLWDGWRSCYGEETTRRIATAHLGEPPLDLTAKGDPEPLARALGAQLLPTGSLRVTATGPVPELAGYAEGQWWVQDAAAALPVRLLGEVAGRHVVDLCAAPGGKTMQLVARGARVTAVDRSETRLRLLRDNLDRVGMDAELVAADATTWRPDGPVDAVLLDAPCSATGTIRRNPDIPRTKGRAAVGSLADVQDQLLRQAFAMVGPGGRVVYCVCSLEAEEGLAAVRRFLAGEPLARPCPPPADPAIQEFLADSGAEGLPHLRTLPFMYEAWGGMDGFFAAALERTG